MRRKAAFIDRDGVINVESAYVYRIEDFVFLPARSRRCASCKRPATCSSS